MASVQSSIAIITNINPSLSLEEVQKRLPVKLEHGFTASFDSNQFLCVHLAARQHSAFFLLIFRNDSFSGILKKRPIVFEQKTFRDLPWSVPKPVDSEEELAAVLKQPLLTAAEIKQTMEQQAVAADANEAGREPGNILPAVAITQPLLATKLPEITKAREEASALIKKYDPFKIKTGMSQTEIQSLFGVPDYSERNGDQVLEVYGAKLPPTASYSNEPPLSEIDSVCMAVVFEKGKVTRVFSHHFFDKRLLRKLKP